jgi:DNA polymerase II large subunit
MSCINTEQTGATEAPKSLDDQLTELARRYEAMEDRGVEAAQLLGIMRERYNVAILRAAEIMEASSRQKAELEAKVAELAKQVTDLTISRNNYKQLWDSTANVLEEAEEEGSRVTSWLRDRLSTELLREIDERGRCSWDKEGAVDE